MSIKIAFENLTAFELFYFAYFYKWHKTVRIKAKITGVVIKIQQKCGRIVCDIINCSVFKCLRDWCRAVICCVVYNIVRSKRQSTQKVRTLNAINFLKFVISS